MPSKGDLEEDASCSSVLQQAAACRGALDGFIAEVIEDHILENFVNRTSKRDDTRVQAAEELGRDRSFVFQVTLLRLTGLRSRRIGPHESNRRI